MKYFKSLLCIILTLSLFMIPLTGCDQQGSEPSADPTDAQSAEPPEETATEPEDTSGETTDNLSSADQTAFSFSNGIDENGFWSGVRALDYVALFDDYGAMTIPADTHTVSGDEVQAQIDSILSYYGSTEQITDRAVENYDTVNIDYVGSVDGVEFDGGNTGGYGADVTIGVTSYIDDFLEQLIGHMPGETINVDVTFPEDYGVDELNGKDAVFVTTINYISGTAEAELTDEFVVENLSYSYGWTTVQEMRDGIYNDMQEEAVAYYIQDYLVSNVTVSSVPDSVMQYMEDSLVSQYEEYAGYYSMELEDFLTQIVGAESLDEVIESNYENLVLDATYCLAIQAVAEEAGIEVSDEDIAEYFLTYMGTDDYSVYVEDYGLPYVKQAVLYNLVLEYLSDNSVWE